MPNYYYHSAQNISPEQLLTKLHTHIESFIQYIQFPSYNEIHTSLLSSTKDSIIAIKSVSYFMYILCRPIVLTIQLILLFLWPYIQIIFNLTLRHVWIIIKKLCMHAKFASISFYKFQRSLSRYSIIIELCIIATFVGLYFLRRYIKKKRYVERLNHWYATRKRIVVKKYESILQRVSETSEICGLLLPHIIYIVACINVKYMIPDITRYIVTQTFTMKIIMLCIPLYQTISFLSVKNRHQDDNSSSSDDKKDGKDDDKKKINDKSSNTNVKAKSSIAMKYLQSSSSSKTAKSASVNSTTTATEKPKKKTNKPTAYEIRKKSILLLQFWTVYSLLHSCYEILLLLPFIQSIFSPVTSRVSKDFMKEIILFFWIWLRYLPITSKSNSIGNLPVSATKKLLGATPTLMLYSKLRPIALYFSNHVDSTTENATSKASSSMIHQKINSLFDIAIFFKLLTTNTKELIFRIVYDGRMLFPGALTLFMPSMFTQYGCIYIKSIVPTMCTMQCCEDTSATSKNINRWLKYWVIQAFIPVILSAMTLPFRTHFTLIVWLYLNLPFEKYVGASFIYELLEYEFICVGLLSPSSSSKLKDEELGIDKTRTLRSIAWVISKLPSSVDSDKEKNKNDNKTKISNDNAASTTTKETTLPLKMIQEMKEKQKLQKNEEEEKDMTNDGTRKYSKFVGKQKNDSSATGFAKSNDDKERSCSKINSNGNDNKTNDKEKQQTSKTVKTTSVQTGKQEKEAHEVDNVEQRTFSNLHSKND